MSDQPRSALDGAKERCGASPTAFDMAAPRFAKARQSIERVVNVYADGRLAYNGFFNLAAIRLDISARALTLSIDRSLAIARPLQPRFYQRPDGRWPRAKTYRAKWRDA